jgi:hypothetical protein
MFLRVYSITGKLIVQTSSVVENGMLQLIKKDGTQVLNICLINTNYVKSPKPVPKGEYQLKLVSNGHEYKKQVRI